MFEYKVAAESIPAEKGAAEVKMWNVLIGQVWSCFSGYVDYRSENRGSTVVKEKGLLADVSIISISHYPG